MDRKWSAPGQPVRWLDLHREEGGDVTALLTELTPEQNLVHSRDTLTRWCRMNREVRLLTCS